jgi:hypothetical protein
VSLRLPKLWQWPWRFCIWPVYIRKSFFRDISADIWKAQSIFLLIKLHYFRFRDRIHWHIGLNQISRSFYVVLSDSWRDFIHLKHLCKFHRSLNFTLLFLQFRIIQLLIKSSLRWIFVMLIILTIYCDATALYVILFPLFWQFIILMHCQFFNGA